MLIGANKIGGARRGVEALREKPGFVQIIVADDRERDMVGNMKPTAVLTGVVLDVNDLKATA
jgi:hypothetical protein